MLPNKGIILLLFLTISTNYGPSGGFVGALPLVILKEGCEDLISFLNTSLWCPSLIPQQHLAGFNEDVAKNQPKCLSQIPSAGQKCPAADWDIIGIGFGGDSSSTSINKSSSGIIDLFWGSCDNYFLLTESSLSQAVSSIQSCLPTNANKNETRIIQLLFRTQINDSFCILSIQQYNSTTTTLNGNEECGIENNHTRFNSHICSQTVYNCSKLTETRFMDVIIPSQSTKGFRFKAGNLQIEENMGSANSTKKKKKVNWKEGPLPLVANSNIKPTDRDKDIRDRNNRDRPRMERSEGIRRVKKPMQFNWRNHILEITIACILAVVVVYYLLKRCCEGKLINFHPTGRVVRFEMEELASADKRRQSSNILVNANNSPKYRNTPIDPNRNPSRPILKNSKNNNNNATNANEKSKPKPPLNRILGQASAAIKSFDSNTSIYFDALEGTVAPNGGAASEEKSQCKEPLMA